MTTTVPPPSTAVDTKKVAPRRKLRFNSLDEILTDVNTLAQTQILQHLGNWSPGQIFIHLANTMNYSIDGFPSQMPAPVRFFMRLVMKGRILKTSMSPGFKVPKSAAYMLPPATSLSDGIAQITRALERQNAETKRVPSPFLGPLTRDEWTQLHCRHAELHLSFLVASGQ